MKLLCNLLCRNVDAQLAFYAAVLGASELEAHRSPIYRALAVDDAELGFNAWPAYRLLGLLGRAPRGTSFDPLAVLDATATDAATTTGFATFQVDAPDDVEAMAARVEAAGGRVLKPPFATYYGQWQAVATDPEHNVFRLASRTLPQGVDAPTFESLGIALPAA